MRWLWHFRERSVGNGRLFSFSAAYLNKFIKKAAQELEAPNASRASTHSLRRGMAQDILDHGGSLATLLKAGDWNSSAYLDYLRFDQPQDVAGQTLISLSDSDDE